MGRAHPALSRGEGVEPDTCPSNFSTLQGWGCPRWPNSSQAPLSASSRRPQPWLAKTWTNTTVTSNSSRPHPWDDPSPPIKFPEKTQDCTGVYCPANTWGCTPDSQPLGGEEPNLYSYQLANAAGFQWTNSNFSFWIIFHFPDSILSPHSRPYSLSL